MPPSGSGGTAVTLPNPTPELSGRSLVQIPAACGLAESPTWRAQAPGSLLWVDCDTEVLHRLVEGAHEHQAILAEGPLTAVCNRTDGGLVLLSGRQLLALDDFSDEPVLVAEIPNTPPGVRFNDGKPAPDGRLWAGTVCRGVAGGGSWWTFHPDEGLVRRIDDVSHANGIGWSGDGTRMYFVDSGARTLSRAAVAPGTGLPETLEVLCEFAPEWGIPDGLAVDEQDHLWLAMWGGFGVLRIDPDGSVVGRLPIKERNVTSCAFIGPDLRTLAVTTAADEVDPSAAGGDVHLIEVGVGGIPVLSCTWQQSKGEVP